MSTNSSASDLAQVVENAQPEIEKDLEMIREIALDYESATLAVAELEAMTSQSLEGVTVYSGKHPKYGNIHIVIPAVGSGMLLLPFAIRDF